MSKSAYKYLAKAWQKSNEAHSALQRKRMIDWRASTEAFVRVEKPLRLDRARALGYRAKPGYVVVRASIRRGSLRKTRFDGGRVPSKMGVNKITMRKNLQRIAEERTAKRYPNMEVLNSYWIGEDGKQKFYEVILVDPDNPSITNDPKINWICESHQKGRVFRGLTSAGKRGRGMRHKGKGAEKVRPSLAANDRRAT